ncbi:MAG: hypothetical protein KDD31_09120 [Muricauda sp.]|nr:hypothetical protein [Allomuricauda sp.]
MRAIVFLIIGTFILLASCKENSKNLIQAKNQTVNKEVNKGIVEPQPKKKKYDTLILLQKKTRSLEDYKESILRFSNSNESLALKTVENIYPINEEEYLLFYSLSYPEEYPESDLELFYKIDKTMLDYAIKDKGDCFFLFSNLAEFVDGEYADYYFEAIESTVKNNTDKFCGFVYGALTNFSKERLNELYEDYCK